MVENLVMSPPFTPEQLAAWKKEFGKDSIHDLAIHSQSDKQLYYVYRAPDRKVTAAFTTMVVKDIDRAVEFLVKNCTLMGDITVALTESDVLLSLSRNIQEKLQTKAEETKKL
jgi:hypothetical protein